MSTPKNGQTPSGGEFDAGAAAGLDLDEAAASAFTASLTEFQRLLLSAGAVVAIGNAPTALFHLLEVLAETGDRPAGIIGIPVGFVGAAESKRALADLDAWLTKPNTAS